jgi:hypothetical protein
MDLRLLLDGFAEEKGFWNGGFIGNRQSTSLPHSSRMDLTKISWQNERRRQASTPNLRKLAVLW